VIARIALFVLIVLTASPAFAQVIVRPPPPPPPPPPIPATPMPQLPSTPTCRQVCIPGICAPGQVCAPTCTMDVGNTVCSQGSALLKCNPSQTGQCPESTNCIRTDLIADEGTKPALSGRIRNGDGAPFPGGNGAPSLEVQTACRRPLWRPEAEEKG